MGRPSGPQFFHLDTFARKPAAKRGGRAWSVRDIVNELIRAPGHCDHVADPKPPRIVFGADPLAVPDAVEAGIKEAKAHRPRGQGQGQGTRIKTDTHVMAVAIASYPARCDTIDTYAGAREAYDDWVRRSIDGFRKFAEDRGGILVSVVEHLDESHPHLHAIILPDPLKNPGYRAIAIHDAKLAKERAIAAGASPREANQAYKAAGTAMQDWWYETVSAFCGHLRLGPNRLRLPAPGYKMAKQAEKIAAAARREAESAIAEHQRLADANWTAAADALNEAEQDREAASNARIELDLATMEVEAKKARIERMDKEIAAARLEAKADREEAARELDRARTIRQQLTDLFKEVISGLMQQRDAFLSVARAAIRRIHAKHIEDPSPETSEQIETINETVQEFLPRP